MGDLAGRVAIVTGGGGGLGRVVAERLAARGARIVVADQQAVAAAAVAAALPDALAVATDIGDPASVAALMDRTRAHYGQLDILVNNAAITGNHPRYQQVSLLDTPLDFWRWIMEINLTAQFVCLQAAARLMAARRQGAIVNVSSISGLQATPRDFAYSVSKAAVLMLTQCAAGELSEARIRVNAVAPSGMWRPTTERPCPTVINNLIGRIAEYDDVADAIIFLCTDEARFVDGQVIAVDGGESISARYRRPRPNA